MIVFNLSCSQTHTFDGWFRSADDFVRQSTHGLVECPVCGDKEIIKRLSAPRINAGAGRSGSESDNADRNGAQHSLAEPAASATSQNAAGQQAEKSNEVLAASTLPGLQQHMMQQFKQFVLTNTENVGSDFAETARRIHYGEESQRNIRGRISADEAVALRDEGIDTVSLPPGVVLDEVLQ